MTYCAGMSRVAFGNGGLISSSRIVLLFWSGYIEVGYPTPGLGYPNPSMNRPKLRWSSRFENAFFKCCFVRDRKEIGYHTAHSILKSMG